MRVKILALGLICFFIFAYCNSPADPEIEKTLNPRIEEGAETQITFNLKIEPWSCGHGLIEELVDVSWYEIFDIYINDGIGTYGDGLLIHTHEFGRDGVRYWEEPERDYSFIPPIDFPGTRTFLADAYERNTEFDFEVWFYLKETNIPPDLLRRLGTKILIYLYPAEQGFECSPFNLDSGCLNDIYHPDEWQVGERTLPDPTFAYSRLWFRVMITDD